MFIQANIVSSRTKPTYDYFYVQWCFILQLSRCLAITIALVTKTLTAYFDHMHSVLLDHKQNVHAFTLFCFFALMTNQKKKCSFSVRN